MNRALKLLDSILGVTNNSTEDRILRTIAGIIVPALAVFYGVSSVLSQRSVFIGRSGMVDLAGSAAVAAGLAWLGLGLLIYVHCCWPDHPRLGGVADFARLLLLVLIGLSMAAMFSAAIFS